MKKIALVILVLVSTSAYADGFVCQTEDGAVTIKAFNNVDPSQGTRNGAVLVFSDNSVQFGRKTIARFTDVKGTMTNSGAAYLANVDLRFADSSRKGEWILGTKLGFIDTIELDIAFSYASPVEHGAQVDGTLTINKRNGETMTYNVECSRYLKNN